MIPVALPSVEAVLLVAFLLATTFVWAVWTLGLLIRYASGRRKRPVILPYGLVTAIAVFTLLQIAGFCLEMRAYDRDRTANYRPQLLEPTRLGQIDMPEGTKLELAIANNRDAFSRAVFPHPVRVADIDAVEIARYIAIKTNDNYETIGFTPDNMRITGNGVTTQSGWRCDATRPVEFDLRPDGGISAFSRCILADGNVVDGITLPMGTSLYASTGNVYIDGFVDSDRWVLGTPQGQAIHVDNFDLSDATIALDDERKLYEIKSAVLSKEAMLGTRRHAAGTHVRYNSRHLRKDYPAAWLLTPPLPDADPQPAPPASLVQNRQGEVLATPAD
ncbi:hypothetical protein M0412_20500 [Agrobacterium sp. O3.4]|uniref:Uncharacterized protein n=1 Tax=Agrobacterium cucumeris TaxID=2862866 RepID=A0ABY8RV08_9HYPH|nr:MULTISPECIES: hypothetical protein [Rhizobium/Agrobacterium group]MCZ7470215.1 hypothetical protein [Rhizobium rhizogenes]WHO11483.1 hypothetical protein KZ699_23770 [Agrobacterium cucumeris]